MSAAQRGKTLSPEHRAKLSAAQKGRKQSALARAKIGAAHRGKPLSPEHRAKLSLSHRGKPLSPEHRAKLSLSHRGERSSAYTHGLYAAPPYPIRTLDDFYRWLGERQARLSALLDQLPTGSPAELTHWANLVTLYSRNASKLARYLRGRWKAQADAEAAEKLLTDTLGELWEEILKEEAEQAKPPKDEPEGE